MTTSVLAFRTRESESDIPLPLNHQPGNTYLRVNLPGDALNFCGLTGGACLIFQTGPPLDGWPHAVCYGGQLHVGAVRREAGLLRFTSWQAGGAESFVTERDVLGALCESYPFGIAGPRWTCVSSLLDGLTLPLLRASAS